MCGSKGAYHKGRTSVCICNGWSPDEMCKCTLCPPRGDTSNPPIWNSFGKWLCLVHVRNIQWNYTRLGTEHVVARSRKLFTFVAKELELMLGTQKSRCAQIFMTRAWVWHFHLTRIFSWQKSPRDVRTLDISADFLQKLRSSNIKHKGNPLEINGNQDIHDIVETQPFYFFQQNETVLKRPQFETNQKLRPLEVSCLPTNFSTCSVALWKLYMGAIDQAGKSVAD